MNRTNIIIGSAFLALIALFAFQTKWMTDSRNLIEEQFNQKVTMAMSYAVGILGNDKTFQATCAPASTSCLPLQECSPIQEVSDGFQLETKNEAEIPAIKSALGIALRFYDIKMDYEVAVVEPEMEFFTLGMQKGKKYSCSLNPLEKNESSLLQISFPGKEQYIFGKMKFMLFTSIIILSFITLFFIISSYTMIRQKRMQEISKEFFNNMAHEFRTPLTNISLAGSLLAKTQTSPKEARYLAVVKEESKKLANQVERILHLAKLENGEYQLDKEELCLNDLIQNVIQDMDLQIKEKNAKINFEIKKESLMLEGDKFHLGNAFRNVLENALKYSKKDPIINIAIEKNTEGVTIKFQDNGIGIAKKDQKEIFEKYRRVNQGDVHNQKGFGLGLAYVKMIVDRHKGMIKIFSDLNKGTRFDLFLPVK